MVGAGLGRNAPEGMRIQSPTNQAARLGPAVPRGGVSQSHAQESSWPREVSWDAALSVTGAMPSLPRTCGDGPLQPSCCPQPRLPGPQVVHSQLGWYATHQPGTTSRWVLWAHFPAEEPAQGGPAACPKPPKLEQSGRAKTWPARVQGRFSNLPPFLTAPGKAAMSLSPLDLPEASAGTQ